RTRCRRDRFCDHERRRRLLSECECLCHRRNAIELFEHHLHVRLIGAGTPFTGVFTSMLADLSSHPLGSVSFQGSISETIFGRTSAAQLGTWNTQITSLDLTGTFQGSTLQVMQDTDHPTLGQTTIA